MNCSMEISSPSNMTALSLSAFHDVPEFDHGEVQLKFAFRFNDAETVVKQARHDFAAACCQGVLPLLGRIRRKRLHVAGEFAELGESFHDGESGFGGALTLEDGRQHVKTFFGEGLKSCRRMG